MLIIDVTQLNTYVKSLLDGDKQLSDLYIKAEISNLKTHYKSGHMYFKLKDEKSSINAVMFAWQAKHLKFLPEDGMEVLAKASVSIYEVDGAFQAYVTDMQPMGIGQASDLLGELNDKLEKKGYFSSEHKKKLPIYPNTIGVITSKTGAVIEDIKNVIERRYPIAKILFCPAIVQGIEAPKSLVSAVKTLDNNCDVIIIGRGGGSTEDISAFNSEKLADAIFSSSTPIISAVGHETDNTICDKVADHRAGTPSVAAEIATPDRSVILDDLKRKQDIAKIYILNNLAKYQQRLSYIESAPMLRSPLGIIEVKKNRLDFIHKTMYNLKEQMLESKSQSLSSKSKVLESLNPLAVLNRGYGAVFKESKTITSVKKLEKNDKFEVRLKDGKIFATVYDIEIEVQ